MLSIVRKLEARGCVYRSLAEGLDCCITFGRFFRLWRPLPEMERATTRKPVDGELEACAASPPTLGTASYQVHHECSCFVRTDGISCFTCEVSSRESRKCFASVAGIRCGRRQSSSYGVASAASGRGIFTGLIAPVVRPACHRKTMPLLFRRRQPWSGFGWPSANTAACQPGCTPES
jgi:hypothetical protein